MTSERRTTILRIISLLAVVAISIWIYTIRNQASELAAFGYPGIFIISILANATVLLPAPGVAVVFTMGGILNPFILGIVAFRLVVKDKQVFLKWFTLTGGFLAIGTGILWLIHPV